MRASWSRNCWIFWPADDPRAMRSRRDLARINAVMRQSAIMAKALAGLPAPAPAGRSGRRRWALSAGRGAAAETLARCEGRDPRPPGHRQPRDTRRISRPWAGTARCCRAIFSKPCRSFRPTSSPPTCSCIISRMWRWRGLLALVAARASGFVACEPRRSAFALLGARLVFVLGANDVTRHDAVASVRAGFRGQDLSRSWPQERAWHLEERGVFPFTHLFDAPMRYDAVIIGAGPAGSAAARLLAAGRLARGAGGEGRISPPQGLRRIHLRHHHAGAEGLRRGGALHRRGGTAGDAGGRLCRQDACWLQRREQVWGRALGREHLDLMLRDAAVAAGAELYEPAEVASAGARMTASGPARWTMAAALRRAPSLPPAAPGTPRGLSPSHRPRRTVPICSPSRRISPAAALPPGLMPLLAFPGGYGGLVESDAGRTSLSCCIRRDVLARVRARHGGKAGEAVLAHILETTRACARRCRLPALEGGFLSTGPIHPGIRARQDDGVFFTGNIAGEAHPVIAEGISMAIQSSALLARLLMAHRGERYASEWRRRFRAPALCRRGLRQPGDAPSHPRRRAGAGPCRSRPSGRRRAAFRQAGDSALNPAFHLAAFLI